MIDTYNIIIVGAGPAGLAAAISASKDSDLNVLILEKQERTGKRKGGQTLNYDKDLEEKIFYPGFYSEISISKTNKYRFHSPSAKHFEEIESTKERFMIDWHRLIDELVKKSSENGVEIKNNQEVNEILLKDDKYTGVTTSDGSTFNSDLLILADGCESPLINKYGVETPQELCPIFTISAENVNLDGNFIELFFSNGEDIPPAVLAMFPQSETSINSDYVQFVGSFKKDYPAQNIKKWWEKMCKENPTLSKRFENASITYTDYSFLPFGGPNIDTIIPKERIFLVGNNAGHNEATGGSGLITSMKMGYEIGLIANEITSSGNLDEFFSGDSKKNLLKRIQRTEIFRYLKRLKSIAVNVRTAFFKILDTPEKVDEKWDSFIAPILKNATEFF
jgi:flavin-dependent dehydrogenase